MRVRRVVAAAACAATLVGCMSALGVDFAAHEANEPTLPLPPRGAGDEAGSGAQPTDAGTASDSAASDADADAPSEPVDAADGGHGAIAQIFGGDKFTCALDAAGAAWCWGHNGFGQLAVPGGERFTSLALGTRHGCGIVAADAHVLCWGKAMVPGDTPIAAGAFTKLAAAWFNTCGIKADQTLACWGDPTTGVNDAPAGKFVRVAIDEKRGCAIRDTGALVCWGHDLAAVGIKIPDGGAREIGMHTEFTCLLDTRGQVNCFGEIFPSLYRDPRGTFSQLAVGAGMACALDPSRHAVCWSQRSDEDAGPAPADAFESLTAGGYHTCGITTPGREARCWGSNTSGQTDIPK